MSTKYTATVKVVVPQVVRCLNCKCEYVYEMTVTGVGTAETSLFTSSATAEAAAKKDAQSNLEFHLNDLENLCSPVPCPKCYQYQPYMHRMVGQSKYDSLGCIGYPLLILGVMVIIGSGVALFLVRDQVTVVKVGIVALVAAVVGHLIVKRMNVLVDRYDPNSDQLEERKKKAAARALSPERYDEIQAGKLSDAYDEYVEAQQPKHAETFPFPESEPEPPVFTWHMLPASLWSGSTITLKLSESDFATVLVPPKTRPRSVLALTTRTANVVPFLVRVIPLHVHPGESLQEL